MSDDIESLNCLTKLPLNKKSVLYAYETIKPLIHETPILTSKTLNALSTLPISTFNSFDYIPSGNSKLLDEKISSFSPKIHLFFKAENFQICGAFKARGASFAISELLKNKNIDIRTRGVCTHSSGNHGASLAFAASRDKIPSHIVMPVTTPKNKSSAASSYGGKIIYSGPTVSERQNTLKSVVKSTNAIVVHPSDEPLVIMGQGTVAIELLKQMKNSYPLSDQIDVIIAPCGGGGLLSGIALACEGTGITVVGAEPNKDGADDAFRGLSRGEIVPPSSKSPDTIADGLRSSLGLNTWKILSDKKKFHSIFTVSDEEIIKSLKISYERLKLVLEPSAVTGIAVVLFNKEWRKFITDLANHKKKKDINVAIVLSGGNITIDKFCSLF